jgi:hypothetical protein
LDSGIEQSGAGRFHFGARLLDLGASGRYDVLGCAPGCLGALSFAARTCEAILRNIAGFDKSLLPAKLLAPIFGIGHCGARLLLGGGKAGLHNARGGFGCA